MWRVRAVGMAAVGGITSGVWAQASEAALRFFGTGQDQQDRVRIRIDDNASGADASAPCDVGAGSFTVDFWVRGMLEDNNTPHAGGDREHWSNNWIDGNIVVDRDIWELGPGAGQRDWGISLAGGLVRFGTGPGEGGVDLDNTIEGGRSVLDGAWHHVAVTRDAGTGRKRIYVDGALDFQSSPGASTVDISYPNGGASQQTQWGPYIVLAAEKHDAGPNYPSFAGYLDEVRVWSRALSGTEIGEVFDLVVDAGAPGLVAAWRFEEGAGVSASDASAAGSPAGEVIEGAPGNGEWVLAASDPMNVAPVRAPEVCPADFNGDGTANTLDVLAFLSAWAAGGVGADFNGDGSVNTLDVLAFLSAWSAGCP